MRSRAARSWVCHGCGASSFGAPGAPGAAGGGGGTAAGGITWVRSWLPYGGAGGGWVPITLVAAAGSYAGAPGPVGGSTWVRSSVPGSTPGTAGTVPGTAVGRGSGCSRAATASASSTAAGEACTPTPAATTRRARASEVAPGRWAGSLRRQRSITVQSGSGMVLGRCGSCARWAWRTARALSPWNGWRPVTSSYSMIPAPYTSTAEVCGRPSADSGATYAGVPTNSWVRVTPGESARRAMPKSVSSGCICSMPSTTVEASSTLAGLRSRWTIPSAWLAASASATWAISRAPAIGLNGPLARR